MKPLIYGTSSVNWEKKKPKHFYRKYDTIGDLWNVLQKCTVLCYILQSRLCSSSILYLFFANIVNYHSKLKFVFAFCLDLGEGLDVWGLGFFVCFLGGFFFLSLFVCWDSFYCKQRNVTIFLVLLKLLQDPPDVFLTYLTEIKVMCQTVLFI